MVGDAHLPSVRNGARYLDAVARKRCDAGVSQPVRHCRRHCPSHVCTRLYLPVGTRYQSIAALLASPIEMLVEKTGYALNVLLRAQRIGADVPRPID